VFASRKKAPGHAIPPAEPIRRQRAPHYGVEVQQALATAWRAANGVRGKRLVPFLPELIPTLERHGHLSLTDQAREALLMLGVVSGVSGSPAPASGM